MRSQGSLAAELKGLLSLKAQGLLTEAEFEQAKAMVKTQLPNKGS